MSRRFTTELKILTTQSKLIAFKILVTNIIESDGSINLHYLSGYYDTTRKIWIATSSSLTELGIDIKCRSYIGSLVKKLDIILQEFNIINKNHRAVEL